MKNSRSNERDTTDKVENQEKTLRIVQIYFVTEKEKNIIMEISYWTKILENYVNKGKPSEKVGNKLVIFIKENKKDIKKMDTYSDKKTQTEKEKSNVKDLRDFSHDNSSTSSLYHQTIGDSPETWRERISSLRKTPST